MDCGTWNFGPPGNGGGGAKQGGGEAVTVLKSIDRRLASIEQLLAQGGKGLPITSDEMSPDQDVPFGEEAPF